jgi:hypothetical protein
MQIFRKGRVCNVDYFPAVLSVTTNSNGFCRHNKDGALNFIQCRTITQAVNRGFPPQLPVFEPRSSHMGFVVDKTALGEIFSEYFGFRYQFSFHRLLHIHHYLLSGAGTIGQLVADVPNGLSVTPLPVYTNHVSPKYCNCV